MGGMGIGKLNWKQKKLWNVLIPQKKVQSFITIESLCILTNFLHKCCLKFTYEIIGY
jgi:hypothetical protein